MSDTHQSVKKRGEKQRVLFSSETDLCLASTEQTRFSPPLKRPVRNSFLSLVQSYDALSGVIKVMYGCVSCPQST